MIPDSDIIKNINFDTFRDSRLYGMVIDYLIKMIHRVLMSHKEVLPNKCTKFKYPTVLRIIPPGHQSFNDNHKRAKFAAAIEKSVMQFNEMRFACMKLWQFNDAELAVETPTGYCFTGKGLRCYWWAIDEAIQFWDKSNDFTNTYQGHHSTNQCKGFQPKNNKKNFCQFRHY